MALLRFSKEDFMLLGLQLCGFSVETIARNCYATNLDRFKGKYYVTPTVASKLFEDIQDESAARINKPSPKYLGHPTATARLRHFQLPQKLREALLTTYETCVRQARRHVLINENAIIRQEFGILADFVANRS